MISSGFGSCLPWRHKARARAWMNQYASKGEQWWMLWWNSDGWCCSCICGLPHVCPWQNMQISSNVAHQRMEAQKGQRIGLCTLVEETLWQWKRGHSQPVIVQNLHISSILEGDRVLLNVAHPWMPPSQTGRKRDTFSPPKYAEWRLPWALGAECYLTSDF